MPDGGSLRLAVNDKGSTVEIEVKDTGIGLGDDEVDEVFERFKKGSTSAGSGLGLTISRDLVEAHGGSIAMESVPGVGTAVVVSLPKVVATT